MEPQYVEELQNTLAIIVSGQDSAKIRAATNTLNQRFFKSPSCVPALAQILGQSQQSEMRQMAAIELRKRIPKNWKKIDKANKEVIKKNLVELAMSEQDKRVRNSVARVIAVIGKFEIPAGQWNDLLQFLFMCCKHENVAQREFGFYVILALLETAGEAFSSFAANMLGIFGGGLSDPQSREIKITTLKSMAYLAEYIDPKDEPSLKLFRKLLPTMVQVLQEFLAVGALDDFSSGMEVFDALITMDSPVLSKHVAELIQFFISVGKNLSCPSEVRVQALTFIMLTAVYRKNKIIKLKLVQPILENVIPIMAEDDPEDEDEDSPSRISVKLLNSIALCVPPSQVFPLIWHHVSGYVQQAAPGFRKAAMMALAAVSDGCSDFIRNEFKIDQIIPLLAGSLKDSDVNVRRAGCIALAAISSDLGAELSEFHQAIMPPTFELLHDSNERIRKVLMESLDTLLEHLGDNIAPYMNALMEKLIVLLDRSDNEDRYAIVSAIGSAAHAAGEQFRPFFPHVIGRLQAFMALTNAEDEDEMMLRGVSTETAGVLAKAVGKEMFSPYLQPLMTLAMEGAKTQVTALSDSAFAFFAGMANLFGEEFAPYISAVVDRLFESCMLQENEDGSFEDEDLGAGTGGDDDGTSDYESGLAYNNAVAEEKEAAIEALGVICEHSTKGFMPFLQKTVEIVQEMLDHNHDDVRRSSFATLYRILRTIYKMHHDGLQWQPGVPCTYQLHTDVQQMIQIVIKDSLGALENEEERAVVSEVIEQLTESLKLMGPALVASSLDPLCGYILNILERKAVCQSADLDADDDDAVNGDDDDEQAEYDAIIIANTADLIGTLALTVGGAFSNYIRHFWPHLAKYYKPSKPVADRSMVIGLIGEIAGGLGKQIDPYCSEMLQMTVHATEDNDPEVRSNAAFATGMICGSTGIDLTEHYPQILMKLAPLFHAQPDELIVDNACGAVSRMILSRPQAVPLDQVLPVLLQNIPLKKDFAENETVLQCLYGLWQAQNALLAQHLSSVVKLLATVLSEERQRSGLKPATLEFCRQWARSIKDTAPFQQAMAGMQQDLRAQMLTYL